MQTTQVNAANVLLNVDVDSDASALAVLAERMHKNGNVKASYASAVIERERVFATALPTQYCSVAIPHTDPEHVRESGIGVAVMKQPVPFVIMGEVSETTPVKLIFMLAMDKADAQLTLLQQLMSVFQDDMLLERIATATSETDVAALMNKALTK